MRRQISSALIRSCTSFERGTGPLPATDQALTLPLGASLRAVLILAATLAIATPGFAQQGWTGVETPVADFVLGEVGTDGVGNVRVIWSEPLGDGVHTVVRTARRSAETGAWSEPAEAYRASVAPGVVCGQLVVDTAGNATASWAKQLRARTGT